MNGCGNTGFNSMMDRREALLLVERFGPALMPLTMRSTLAEAPATKRRWSGLARMTVYAHREWLTPT